MTKKKDVEGIIRSDKAIITVVIGLIVVIFLTLIVIAMMSIAHGQVDEGKEETKGFEYNGYIDCMPPLSSEKAKLCEEAEKAGYDKIVY